MPNESLPSAPPRRDDIPGWGSDLDRASRPAVPMERMPARIARPPHPPEQQHSHAEVLVSPERPGITPIYGTTAPPRGLSGVLRRTAYRQTENDIRHWLLLLLADRVDAVEGIGDDLRHGHIPNVFSEMGLPAAWKHNPRGVVRKAAIGAAVLGVSYWLLRRRK
ncbi:hypothetical protein [Duganella sp.]|uniref:hypothetical protein n=1 Tax=Duganella sp. TaxID=1904440 RepID=UPI0031D9769D